MPDHIHTLGDEIIPCWHEPLYLGKVTTTGAGSLWPIPSFRHGHCNFAPGEVLAAFGVLVLESH